MRIGIDLVPLRSSSGGARYVFTDLFRQLLRLDREHYYILFAHPRRLALLDDILDPHFADRVRVIPAIEQEQIYPHREKFDLYFCPFNTLRPRIFDRPTVPILHDIQEQYFPNYFSQTDLLSRNEAYPELCRAATTVVTVSHFSKRCIVEKFAIDPRKIEVMHIAPQAGIISTDSAAESQWPYDPVPSHYFLYPANTYPHKNHALLLDAVSRLIIEDRQCPGVIFTGHEMPGGFPLAREIEKRKLADHCRIQPHLTNAQVGYLYRHALATVMPTMFEGFGMPAVEALACGCPLVCSDIASLREVAGENALYFHPGDIDDLCEKLREVSRNPAVRQKLSETGPSVAARFTWESAGRTLLKVFGAAGDRFRTGPVLSAPDSSMNVVGGKVPVSSQDGPLNLPDGAPKQPRIGSDGSNDD